MNALHCHEHACTSLHLSHAYLLSPYRRYYKSRLCDAITIVNERVTQPELVLDCPVGDSLIVPGLGHGFAYRRG